MRLERWPLERRTGARAGASGGTAGGAPPDAAPSTAGPSVCAVGTFDGLHVGHRALVARAIERARAGGLEAKLLSFEPMPREFLRPADPPARLTSLRERWRLLTDGGLDALSLLRFDRRLQQYDGSAFIGLLAGQGVREIVVGHDFRFGRGAEASAEFLAERARPLGIAVEIIDPVLVDGERVSSGAIRLALEARDFQRAERLLGRPYTMRGRVRRGQQLGRQLGIATANIGLHRRRSALAGIYAVRVSGAGLVSAPGVASLGTRPTVQGTEPLLEVHLFDFAGDLYGRELEVEFVAWQRAEQRFDSLPPLVEQMRRDVAEARRILGVVAMGSK